MGALLVSMGFTMAGISLSAIPSGLSNAAQLVIGVSLRVPVVTAFQVCRLVAVLLLVNPLFLWWRARV